MNESVDVVISFDTTGSMYPCLSQVRRVCEEMVKDLFHDIPGLRVGIIAHGDYCDARSTYVTKVFPLSTDKAAINKFIRTVEATGGGDSPECYELVLHEARQLHWSASKSKVLVMIGDDVPHPPNYALNTKKLDWRNEIDLLTTMGVNVYGVQALGGYRSHATAFYREIAEKTGGFHLSLDQFATVRDLIMAICYKQVGPEALQNFEEAVVKAHRMNRGLEDNFAVLAGRKKPTVYSVRTDEKGRVHHSARSGMYADKPLEAVDSSRFQILEVDRNCAIKDFVIDQGLIFKTGRGFYEFTKAETIQHHKEIVLVHDKTGDMFTGDKAREMLGLPIGETARTRFKPLDGYTVFVQSTSYNRKLMGGTKFLYEVDLSR